jgi:hypothetical protein
MIKLATRYRCPLQVTAQCWGDQSKRKTCPGCGARQYALHGRWGVFTWRGDGRYPESDAHATYVRESAAEAFAEREGPGSYVVRWIMAPQS